MAFNLTYQELLERKKGFYQHTVFVNPGQVVDDMQIEVAIQESREITSIDATTKVLSNDIYTGTTEFEGRGLGISFLILDTVDGDLNILLFYNIINPK